MKTLRALLVFALVLIAPGCVSQATHDHIDTQIAAHDGYERLIGAALKGNLKGAQAKDNVTQAALNKTPRPVYKLLQRCLTAIHKSKLSWHVVKFTLGDGPDPEKVLDLIGPEPKLPPQKGGILDGPDTGN